MIKGKVRIFIAVFAVLAVVGILAYSSQKKIKGYYYFRHAWYDDTGQLLEFKGDDFVYVYDRRPDEPGQEWEADSVWRYELKDGFLQFIDQVPRDGNWQDAKNRDTELEGTVSRRSLKEIELCPARILFFPPGGGSRHYEAESIVLKKVDRPVGLESATEEIEGWLKR